MTENEINLLDINQAYHDFFAFKCENLMEAYNTTIMAGMTAILLHVFMAILFKVFGGKIIGKDVNMAANIIVFGYTVFLCVFVGATGWIQVDEPRSAEDRLLSINSQSLWLTSTIFGILVIYDIPCRVRFIPALRNDTEMLLHHCIWAFTAFIGSFGLLSGAYYYLFFFGFCEISSIPLVIVDFFHPRKFGELIDDDKINFSIIGKINDIARFLYPITYLLLRGLYFPFVYAACLIPDLMYMILDEKSPVSEDQKGYLWLTVLAATCLLALQLYWAEVVFYQFKKWVGNDDGKPKPNTGKRNRNYKDD